MDLYLETVRTFADNVLEHGRDTHGPKHTPLFVDGINVDTLQPPVWKRDGEQWILSNMATQQTLFRVLDGLSAATGDPKYRDAAMAAIRYQFDSVTDPGGMIYWGGHSCYDALGEKIVGESPNHEYKHHYPYYELMWQVDPEATRRHIEAAWTAHIIDWGSLDFNRHGPFGEHPEQTWDHEFRDDPVPFEGKGLTFMMSATDLMYAAAKLSKSARDRRPLTWAKRLAKRYVDARHPDTGLGAENFSVTPNHRMEKQFPQFDGRFSEATVTDLYGSRYTFCASCQLGLGETLGADGREFMSWAVEDLTARANHGYEQESNSFWATLIDGTKLSPADRELDGYVTDSWLEKRPADGRHLLVYAQAYRLSGNDLMWQMTRKIGRGLGLGDFGGAVDLQTLCDDPFIMFALLELHQATGVSAYLDLARRVAGNAVAKQFHHGFFVESEDHIHGKFDDPLPLALLHLRAAERGLDKKPPAFWLSRGYFHCPYDGVGRTYDRMIIYPRLRGEPEP